MTRTEEFRRLFGDAPELEDIPRQREHRRRILDAPATEEERRVQQAFLEGVTARAASGAQMRDRDRRLAHAQTTLAAAFDTLGALSSLDPALRMPDYERQHDETMLAAARSLFLLGMFDEAKMFAGADEQLLAAIVDYHDASLELDSREPCECRSRVVTVADADLGMGGATGPRDVENPKEFEEAEFPFPKLQCWVHALRCVQCGRLRMTTGLSADAKLTRSALASLAADHEVLRPRG